jgi:hypothetical protein
MPIRIGADNGTRSLTWGHTWPAIPSKNAKFVPCLLHDVIIAAREVRKSHVSSPSTLADPVTVLSLYSQGSLPDFLTLDRRANLM